MRLKPCLAIFLLLFAPWLLSSTVVGQTTPGKGDQKNGAGIFYEEDGSFPSSTPLPENVLEALAGSEEGSYARDFKNENPGADLNRFFRSAKVRLSDHDETSYVVNGIPPLAGADCGWFWIVVSNGNKARVVFFEGTSSVHLLKHRTNGYRDIETIWASASHSIRETFQFNGKEYKLTSKSEKKTRDF